MAKKKTIKGYKYQLGGDIVSRMVNTMDYLESSPSNILNLGNPPMPKSSLGIDSSGIDAAIDSLGTSNNLNWGGAGNYLNLATTMLPGVIDMFSTTANERAIDERADNLINSTNDLANTRFEGSNASLAKQSTMLPTWQNVSMSDLGGEESVLGSGISGGLSAASTMAATGNPWLIGGAALLGAGVNLFNTNSRNERKRQKVKDINIAGRNAEKAALNNFNSAVAATDAKNDRWRMQNMYNSQNLGYAFGGILGTKGANWSTDASYIDNGNSHEKNPYGGIQIGVASDGLPNYVEQGEVILNLNGDKNNRYVLSDRVKPTLQEIKDARITDKPEKYKGLTVAEIYKDIVKENKVDETINRKDTKDYLMDLHNKFADMQEESKLRKQRNDFIKMLRNASPEEQDYIMQAMMQNQQPNGQMMQQPVMEEQMADPYNQSVVDPQQLQQQGFAKGGHLFQTGGWETQDDLNRYYEQQFTNFWNSIPTGRKGSNVNKAYLTGAQARHWVNQLSEGDAQQQALAGMIKRAWGNDLDWGNNATWEFKNKYSPTGVVTESQPYLDWAKNNPLQRDALLGIRHVPQLEVDAGLNRTNNYLVTNENASPVAPWLQGNFTTDSFARLPLSLFSRQFNFKQAESVPFKNEETWGINPLYIFTQPSTNLNNTLQKDTTGNWVDTEQNKYWVANNNSSNTSNTENNISKIDSKDESSPNIPTGNMEGVTDYSWIMPAISGLGYISDLLGYTNVPDYSNANRIGRAILPPNIIDYNPNGRYVQPILTDRNYITSRMLNSGNANISALKDLSGANAATAMAQMNASNYGTMQGIGNTLAQINNDNNDAIRQSVAANNAVDLANAQGAFSADSANQSSLENYARRYAAQKTAEAQLRETIDNQVAANRSNNWNNFTDNLNRYFQNRQNREMANLQYAWSGYSYQDKDGKIHLMYDTPKQKKEAEKLAKGNSNVVIEKR